MLLSRRRSTPFYARTRGSPGLNTHPRSSPIRRFRVRLAALLVFVVSSSVISIAGIVSTMPTAQAAAVYRTVGPDGTVSYSDQPPPAGTPVDVIETTESEAAPPGSVDPRPTQYADDWGYDDEVAEARASEYQSIAWVSPQHDAAVRANGGMLQVTVTPTPRLQPGHQIEILLDGASVGRAAGTTITATAVDRGSHQLVARVLDAAGATLLTSPPITVHVLRHSVATPPRRANGAR